MKRILLSIILIFNLSNVEASQHNWYEAIKAHPPSKHVTEFVDLEKRSPEMQGNLDFYYQSREEKLLGGFPDDKENLEAWKKSKQAEIAFLDSMNMNQRAIEKYDPKIIEHLISEVPVLEVLPSENNQDLMTILYFHGGGFVYGTANSTIYSCAPLAVQGNYRVLSIDYTTAPFKKSTDILKELMDVVSGIGKKGYKIEDLTFLGDSAGANLATSLVLQLLSLNKPAPRSLVLWAPWLDLTCSGQSMETLNKYDPVLSSKTLSMLAKAYVDENEGMQNPFISPLFSDLNDDFPRCLIIGGTNDILRSDWDTFSEKLANVGVVHHYILYNHLTHGFMAFNWDPREAEQVLDKTIKFINE